MALLTRITLPLLLVALCTAAGSAWAGDAAGRIDAIKGEVHLLRDGHDLPVHTDTVVETGDHILTGKASRVRILFNDRSTMQLGQNAEAAVERYRTDSHGSIIDGLLDLIEGRGRFIVQKLRGGDAHYSIRTRAVLIGVRGTDILAQAHDYISHVALAQGEIVLSQQGSTATVDLHKDQYLLVVGRWPATPQAIPEQWLNDFINDVGTSDGGRKKKKSGAAGEAASAPVDAMQQKMLNQMGSPMVVPQ